MFNPCIRNCLRELAQKLENDTSGSYYQELFSISQRLRDGELDDSEAASEIYDFLLVSVDPDIHQYLDDLESEVHVIDFVLRSLEPAASDQSDFCRLKGLVSDIRHVLNLTIRA